MSKLAVKRIRMHTGNFLYSADPVDTQGLGIVA